MSIRPLFVAAAALLATLGLDQPAYPAAASYTRLADYVLRSPVIVRATISKVQRLSSRNAPGLASGQARLLLTVTTEAALVAPGPVPAQMSWLLDVPLDARGRVPDLRGQRIMASLEEPDAQGRTRLTGPEAQLAWSEALEARLRQIATEARSGTVPEVTGVTNGFRVAGTLPGESESQFFLSTRDGKPLTLVMLERPGQVRSIAVASGDIIDESATSVKPETLLWYRLACGLPRELPRTAGGNDPALANAWIGIMTSLGPCER
jgi:hypothetical protein